MLALRPRARPVPSEYRRAPRRDNDGPAASPVSISEAGLLSIISAENIESDMLLELSARPSDALSNSVLNASSSKPKLLPEGGL